MCCVKGGKSIDTTMGMTPLEGCDPHCANCNSRCTCLRSCSSSNCRHRNPTVLSGCHDPMLTDRAETFHRGLIGSTGW